MSVTGMLACKLHQHSKPHGILKLINVLGYTTIYNTTIRNKATKSSKHGKWENYEYAGKIPFRSQFLRTAPDPSTCSLSKDTYMGIHLLRDPTRNKGMAFTLKERQMLGLHGLLPPRVYKQDEQILVVTGNIDRLNNDVDKYVYLMDLQDRNEKLFYHVLRSNMDEYAPILYSRKLGYSEACQKNGIRFKQPRGLYITINDKGHIYRMLSNWPENDSKILVVTDGEQTQGLGDLGAYGMTVPVGKLALYTAMVGVPPPLCLPIVLDVGTDNQDLLFDPMYVGVRQTRIRGRTYDEFMKEFMEAVIARFGHSTLIHLEDFNTANTFGLQEQFGDRNLIFNCDIQGTAAMTLAAVYGTLRVSKSGLNDQRFLIVGDGKAAVGIARLFSNALQESGLSKQEALDRIWIADAHGLLTNDRPGHKASSLSAPFSKNNDHIQDLEQIVRTVKPTALLGASGSVGIFTPQILMDMAAYNTHPLIYALSNLSNVSECTADDAIKHTKGQCMFVSGCESKPVTFNNMTYYPSTANSAYIYPGVGFGAVICGATHITDGLLIDAAKVLSTIVSDDELALGKLFPSMSSILEVSTELAANVVQYSYDEGLAVLYPEPADKIGFVKQHQYNTHYESFVAPEYSWPNIPY